jgi:hypothetical protein
MSEPSVPTRQLAVPISLLYPEDATKVASLRKGRWPRSRTAPRDASSPCVARRALGKLHEVGSLQRSAITAVLKSLETPAICDCTCFWLMAFVAAAVRDGSGQLSASASSGGLGNPNRNTGADGALC